MRREKTEPEHEEHQGIELLSGEVRRGAAPAAATTHGGQAEAILFEYLPYANPQDVRDGAMSYLMACQARGNSLHTLANKRIRLRAFYTWLGHDLKIPHIKFPLATPESFTDVECQRLIASAGKHQLMVKTLLYAGLRASEIANLRCSDVTARGIRVRAADAKSGRERTVVVPPDLLAELRQRGSGEASVFGLKNRDRVHDIVKQSARRAGIDPKKAWPHKLRNSYATRLLRRGIDIATVSKQLGHSTITVTSRYLAALEDEELQSKVTKVWE